VVLKSLFEEQILSDSGKIMDNLDPLVHAEAFDYSSVMSQEYYLDEYLNIIDREIRGSIGLYETTQWENFLKHYIKHVSQLLKKEKIKNKITGKLENPDIQMIKELEDIVTAPKGEKELNSFRQNMISQLGAWSLDNPKKEVIYEKVFPEHYSQLEKHYFEKQKTQLTKMHDALLVYGTERDDRSSEGAKLAQQTIQNMVKNKGYCENCAREVIIFLMQERY